MDGQHSSHRRKLRIQFGLGFEEGNGQSSLPIVGVQNVGRAELAKYFQDAAGKEDKSLRVIGVITIRRAIQEGPIEIPVRPNEIDGDVLFSGRGEQRALLGPAGHGDAYAEASLPCKSLLEHVAIGRQYQTDLVTEAPQGAGERAYHVRQAARLGKGDQFWACHDDS